MKTKFIYSANGKVTLEHQVYNYSKHDVKAAAILKVLGIRGSHMHRMLTLLIKHHAETDKTRFKFTRLVCMRNYLSESQCCSSLSKLHKLGLIKKQHDRIAHLTPLLTTETMTAMLKHDNSWYISLGITPIVENLTFPELIGTLSGIKAVGFLKTLAVLEEAGEPLTAKGIYYATDVPEATMYNNIKHLLKLKVIKRTNRSKYGAEHLLHPELTECKLIHMI